MTRHGGFLRDVDQFDCGFFGIAPREAQGHRSAAASAARSVVGGAGTCRAGAPRARNSKTGVYFGLCANDYAYLQILSGDPGLLDAHFGSGIAHSIASGRLSYLLGLQGPSLTIDTACSSSLVAVHLACQALRSGDCRMALAGGVNLILGPELFVALSHSRMLAPDGRCKTFSAAADGFSRGEGCGVVVLKKLADAKADGDRILAVIRGTAVNQDGPSSALDRAERTGAGRCHPRRARAGRACSRETSDTSKRTAPARSSEIRSKSRRSAAYSRRIAIPQRRSSSDR